MSVGETLVARASMCMGAGLELCTTAPIKPGSTILVNAAEARDRGEVEGEDFVCYAVEDEAEKVLMLDYSRKFTDHTINLANCPFDGR